MSKLLKHSERWLDMAKYAWQCASVDDSFISQTCFDLQQTLELALRYLLTLYAVDYHDTHDFEILINLCSSIDLPFEIPSCFKIKAATYNYWEESSREDDDFNASKEDIEELFVVLPDFIQSINKLNVMK